MGIDWFWMGMSVIGVVVMGLFAFGLPRLVDYIKGAGGQATPPPMPPTPPIASGIGTTAAATMPAKVPSVPTNAGTSGSSAAAPTTSLLEAMQQAKPHLLIIGHTGGGKSVLARAFTKHLVDSGAQVVAIDPDAAPRHYPSQVQLINDEDQWLRAIGAIREVFDFRNEKYRDGQETFEPMWIVVDECQELLALEGVMPVINKKVIRRGRKLNIHICLAVQDSQVKTLGLEGQSKLLDNLSRVDVRQRGSSRVASLDGTEYEVPVFPTTYDGAKGMVLSLASAPMPVEPLSDKPDSDKKALARRLLEQYPTLGMRDFTSRLYGGNGTGQAHYLAKKIREEILAERNDDETGLPQTDETPA